MILIEAAQLLREIDIIIDGALVGIANESAAGNLGKENYWRGEMAAAQSLRKWAACKIDTVPRRPVGIHQRKPEIHHTPTTVPGHRTHADHTAPKD